MQMCAVFFPFLWSSHKALVVIDVQNDFISGTLAVQTSEDIVTIINDIRDQFDCAPCLDEILSLLDSPNAELSFLLSRRHSLH